MNQKSDVDWSKLCPIHIIPKFVRFEIQEIPGFMYPETRPHLFLTWPQEGSNEPLFSPKASIKGVQKILFWGGQN